MGVINLSLKVNCLGLKLDGDFYAGWFEDTLSKEQYSLSLQYDKRQTKDFLRGEAMLNNKYLDDLHNDLLESDALCVRIVV